MYACLDDKIRVYTRHDVFAGKDAYFCVHAGVKSTPSRHPSGIYTLNITTTVGDARHGGLKM